MNPRQSSAKTVWLLVSWLTVGMAALAGCSLSPSNATLPATTAAPSPSITITTNHQWTARTQIVSGVAMILVPSGCFLMGSDPAQDSQANTAEEQPQTKVCFQHAFWLDQAPVTQAQFKQFHGASAHASKFSGDNRPVEQITWFEAKAYCEQQRGGRLPTEAEYEYAARGPDDLLYPWGNTFDASQVVYYGNASDQTATVGSKPGGQSWVGALDISGNVWEWTSSLYKPYPYQAGDGRESDLETDSARSVRGGAWLSDGSLVRAAARGAFVPSFYGYGVGFRCVHAD